MKSMHKFFNEQMAETTSAYAIRRLSRRLLPKLCIENGICPGCGEDLEEKFDPRGAYIKSTKRFCSQCSVEFCLQGLKTKGVVYGERGQYSKPTTFIRQKSTGSGS